MCKYVFPCISSSESMRFFCVIFLFFLYIVGFSSSSKMEKKMELFLEVKSG